MDPTLRQAARDYLVRYGGDTFANLFVEAKGTIVRDDTGREILDFTPPSCGPSIPPATKHSTCSAA